MKYGFEGSISNDLGLCKASNQLMCSFVTFWFCKITQITFVGCDEICQGDLLHLSVPGRTKKICWVVVRLED